MAAMPPTEFRVLRNVWGRQIRTVLGATALTHYTSALQIDFGSSPPVWSPDGSKFVYTSGYALDGSDAYNPPVGVQNLWVVNADGSGSTPLTKLTITNCFSPVWSPDGSKIGYFSRRVVDGSDADTATSNVWVINADGSNSHPVTKLTTQYVDSENPQWSPDSTELTFDSSRALDGSDGGNGTLPNTLRISGSSTRMALEHGR